MDPRALAWRIAPGVMADRAVNYERNYRDQIGDAQRAQAYVDRYGPQVKRGPLAGLSYFVDGDSAVAKMVGSYEREIEPWISDALQDAAPFIDFGAADGFYAVGVARARSGKPVVAYELSKSQRQRLRALATFNATSVRIKKRASRRIVPALPLQGATLLCDVEGAEDDILNGAAVPALAATTLIVEVHEHARPGVGDRLISRFESSHRVEVVHAQPRLISEYSELLDLPHSGLMLDEHRAVGQRWLRLTPR